MRYWSSTPSPASSDLCAPGSNPAPARRPRALLLLPLLTLLALLVALGLQGARPAGKPGGTRLPRLNSAAPPAGHLVSRMPLDSSTGAPPAERSGRRDGLLAPASPYRHDFVDLPCNVFLPTKAVPSQRASTITAVEQTYDGFVYTHGYTDFSQTYDLLVGGLQQDGVLLQDAVGMVCAPLTSELTRSNVDWIEYHFTVRSTNNYPTEYVGIVDMMDSQTIPHSQSTETEWAEWFYDARGLWGSLYFLDALSPGAYVIDLGPQAVLDLQNRVGAPGWFGVGMAADGWDLAGSPGQLIFNRSAGGGDANPSLQPYFRVYYNSPPGSFALSGPANGARTTDTTPELNWGAACDPNYGDAVTYTLEYDVSPSFPTPVSVPGLTTTNVTLTVPLAASHTYWWRIRAIDNRQNVRLCDQAFALTIDAPSAVGETPPPVGPRLGHPWPNPMSTTLQVTLQPGSPTPLAVYDVQGRRVALLDPEAGGGLHRWNGRTDTGALAAAGNYYLVMGQEHTREVRPFRLVR